VTLLHEISYDYFDAVSLGDGIRVGGTSVRVGGIGRAEATPMVSSHRQAQAQPPTWRPSGVGSMSPRRFSRTPSLANLVWRA
jgi:hypothetical protein